MTDEPTPTPSLLTVDRSPMLGKSGRRYIVTGEKEPSAWAAVQGPFFRIVVSSPGRFPELAPIPLPGKTVVRKFWDVDAGVEAMGNPCLSPAEARSLANRLARFDAPWLLFQCEAGMCRSAGLCVAVARHFGDDEVAAECYRRYQPNELVVERLSAALRENS